MINLCVWRLIKIFCKKWPPVMIMIMINLCIYVGHQLSWMCDLWLCFSVTNTNVWPWSTYVYIYEETYCHVGHQLSQMCDLSLCFSVTMIMCVTNYHRCVSQWPSWSCVWPVTIIYICFSVTNTNVWPWSTYVFED